MAVALATKMGYQNHELPRLKLEILRNLIRMSLPISELETLVQFVDTYADIEGDVVANKQVSSLLEEAENKEVKMLLTMWEKRGLKKGREEGREEGWKRD